VEGLADASSAAPLTPVPTTHPAGRLLDLDYASISDGRVRSLLRDASALEAQVTALQIAALKRVGRRSRLLILDRSGAGARAGAAATAAAPACSCPRPCQPAGPPAPTAGHTESYPPMPAFLPAHCAPRSRT
jgi:hypothetical protein